MKKTGVFAIKEEIEELAKLAEEARNTPAILLFGKHDMAGDAWRKAQKRCHELALMHGLPEITGFYGIDNDGEFVQT